MMMKMPQPPTPQELAGAQMNGMKVFSLKWVCILVILVLEIVFIHASYNNQYQLASMSEDYQIVDCQLEEQGETCLVYVTVQSLNGQEQTVEIYNKSGRLLSDITNTELLLPAYETITITIAIDTNDINTGQSLYLKTYEEQYWEVELP